MAYQLKKLGIQNFVGIRKGTVEFARPVALFAGLNNQGKTTVKDSIEFAFTGKARRIGKFKDVSQLAYEGTSKEMLISLDYLIDGEPAHIERKASNASEGVDNQNPLIPYCLDPSSFLALPAKQRGAILSQVLSGGMDELVEEAIAEHIGVIDETILAELRSSGTDKHDVDTLRDSIVNIRRNYKRQREECELATEPKLAQFSLPDDFDIAATEKAIEKLNKRLDEGRKYLSACLEAERRKGEIVDLQKRIKQLKGQIKEPPILAGKMSEDMIDTTMKVKDVIVRILKHMETNGLTESSCLICKSLITKRIYEDTLAEISLWSRGVVDKYREKQEIEQTNVRLQTEIEQCEQRIAELKTLSANDKDYVGGSEDKFKELTSLRDQLKEHIFRYRNYREACNRHAEAIDRKGKLSNLITECDRIDEALKDGGPVKSSIAAGGRNLPINKTMLEVWGMAGLNWKDNGEITLNGRPIEQASKSEQYRAAAVMGLALAEVGGVGFCALDEFEILDGNNANRFFDAVQESGINNVLVFASTEKDFSKTKINWLEIFKVEAGQIMKIS